MKRIERRRFMACMVIAVLVIAGGAFAASASNLRKIVVFVAGTSWEVQQQVIARSGSRVLNVLPLIDGVAIELPAQGTEQALSTLKADPNVQGVYNDRAITAQGAAPISAEGIVVFIKPTPAPTDESYSWGLDQIGIPDVHKDQAGLAGSGVKVAILDTGIDWSHPDLKQNIIGGVNARAGEDQSNYQDDNGHGTHVAGIIAARSNNKGVIGAAPHVGIYAIKVLDQDGAGHFSDLISGLGWVRANKINLVNMSLGFPQEWGWDECLPPAIPESPACPYPYPVLAQAIKRLYDAGVIMVAAAGNTNPRLASGAEGAGGDGAGGDGAGGDGAGGDTGPGCTPQPTSTAQGAGGDGAGGDGAGGDGAGGDGAGGDGAGGDGAGGDDSGTCPTPLGYQTTKVKVPAAYPWVIAVGATDKEDRVTAYSRMGPEMADHGVVAPGGKSRNEAGVLDEGILSANIDGGYGLGIGTSQAAAHVTGTLALALQLQRNLSFEDILDALNRTASPSNGNVPCKDEKGVVFDISYCQGAGVIDAGALVNDLKK